jgi:endogenous inhibitor of DNA gyrase (YacG/DUF329 family)
MIDLGAWATEAYRIPVAQAPESDDDASGESAGDESQRS